MFSLSSRPPGLAGGPVISDISLIRLSPGGAGESTFLPPHSYVSPHVEHYLRSAHGSPTLSMISAARGLSPADGETQTQHRSLNTLLTVQVNWSRYSTELNRNKLEKLLHDDCQWNLNDDYISIHTNSSLATISHFKCANSLLSYSF